MYFYFIAGVAALGGLLFGYDTGVISGALLFIRQVMSLSPTMQGVVVAIALAGAAVGAATAGLLSDRAGRRRVILGAGLLFIAGALISAVAQNVIVLLGRPLSGRAGDRRRIDAGAAVPGRDLAGARAWRDRVAEPALHHRRDIGVLPGRVRAGQRHRGMALDARSRGAARPHPLGRHAVPAGKPAMARRSRPHARRRDGVASPARRRRRIG